jgi:hypothetical protein
LKDQFVGCISAKLAAGLTAEQTSETGAAQVSPSAPTSPTQTVNPAYAYVPPSTSQSAPHLQVLPDVARTWAPWVGAAIGGLAVLLVVVRWLRSR